MTADNLLFLCAVLAGTILISDWSARSRPDPDRFYAASRGLTGTQNGLAIAGDFISAASFLGVSGAVARTGFAGLLYGASFLLSYPLLWLVAEAVHRLGRYTLADALDSVFGRPWLRLAVAVNTLVITIAYLVPQLMAAGELAQALLGWPRVAAILCMGAWMTLYVVLGGMLSTSWIQIVKTVLLLSGAGLTVLIVAGRSGWHPWAVWQAARGVWAGTQGAGTGNAWATLSTHLPIVLGTMGMPHILIRFLTVRSEPAVRRSLATATTALAAFYLLVLVLGTAAAAWGAAGPAAGSDGSLAVVVLARGLGGPLWAAYISAVAFATVIAVVTGLLLTATGALAHDILHQGFGRGAGSASRQLRLARLCAAGLGLVATVIASTAHGLSVTSLVTWVFVWAAATHSPMLLCTIYWRRFRPLGAMCGMVAGALVMSGWVIAHLQRGGPVAGAAPPGVWAILAGLAGCILGTFAADAWDAWPRGARRETEDAAGGEAGSPWRR